MSILNGIQNFLQFVNDNWTIIIVIIGLIITIITKVKDYLGKSKEEKIEIAKKQIEQIMLKLVTEAEIDYNEWFKAGAIKRAQVIDEIFLKYPILSKTTNQDELIMWFDIMIDESLETMKDIISKNIHNAVDSVEGIVDIVD